MHDELDQLLKLTKCLEAESTREEYEDDIPASIPTYDEKGNISGALMTKDSEESEDDDEEKPSKKPAKKKGKKRSDDDNEENPEEDDEEKEEDDDEGSDSVADDEGLDDDQPMGSSGNVIDHKSSKKGGKSTHPIFEPDTGEFDETFEGFDDFGASESDDDSEAEEESMAMPSLKKELGKMTSITDAIAMGMGRRFAQKIKFEAANPLFVSNAPFKLGDIVSAKDNPMLYVVKNTDGPVITAAKPTDNSADWCHCKDGCWPEYTFDPEELSTMSNASLDDVNTIKSFNDRFRGFDGTIEDKSPMDRAQEFAKKQTIEDISQNLDEILGQYTAAAMGGDDSFTYTECSPKVLFKQPDGSVTATQHMGGYKIKWGD